MDKKGVELAINFLVTVILSLVILSLGIVLVRNMFSGSQELSMTIDQSIEAELKAAVASGKSVYVYPKIATINPSDSKVFGVSVLNVGRDDLLKCTVYVGGDVKIYTMTNEDVTDSYTGSNPTAWVLNPGTVADLKGGDSTTFPIMIKPDNGVIKDHIYVYDFIVKRGTSSVQYGNTQKVYLTIA